MIFLMMLERVGLLLVFSFLLSRLRFFRQIIYNETGTFEKALLIILFGLFGVLSNYTGIKIEQEFINGQAVFLSLTETEALANTRLMGVAIGGLFGGPIVGTGAGLIAGIHRFSLGGFTAVACGISTIVAGFLTGYLGQKYRIKEKLSYKRSIIIVLLMEILQMLLILVIARPFSVALQLVEIIALPMIIMNVFGTFLFLLIVKSMIVEEERTKTLQTHKTFHIAQLALPHFRKGLNEESCLVVAKIIQNETKAAAVSITSREDVLAHVGKESDHHFPQKNILTQLTKRVLEEERMIIAKTAEEIGCNNKNCTLKAAIVLPLKAHQQTVGCLKLYFTKPEQITPLLQELAEGLNNLFSTQLEIAEAELQSKLLKDAEIKALQAQIHPHFLFNSINTISSLIRTDSDKARLLLIKLGTYFRSNIQGARQILIPLEKELEHVDAYLSIVQARFPNKYTVSFEIDEKLLKIAIPPFTLQPLVENAIGHAFKQSMNGNILITAKKVEETLVLTTKDNGIGISQNKLTHLGRKSVSSESGTGTALWNIKQRINELYGKDASFSITSKENEGTKVTIQVPLKQTRWRDLHVESLYN